MSVFADGVEVLIRYRKEITSFVRKIAHRINYGNEKIIVVGAGGVGKTTLGRVLSGEEVVAGEEYEESINTEIFSYEGKIFGSLLIAPGQGRRRTHSWPSLRNQIAKGEIVGVIFVVAAGYNSLREIEPHEHTIFKQDMTDEEFMHAYRNYNLERELRILKDELAPSLIDAPKRLWFVTAILKKDLWWKRRTEVIDYYQKGKYSKAVSEIAAKRGGTKLPYECVAASLLIENLVTRGGRNLAETCAGFDSEKQLDSVREVCRIVSELIVDKEIQGG